MLNNKESIGLVVDEGADLPKDIVEKYEIEVVPLKADWPEVQDLPGENTFQKMREAEKRGIKSFGKTSQPSPKDFLTAFKKQLEKFEKIICLTITSKHSGTYNSALQGKNFLETESQKRVFVVDSLNASCALGLLVLKAAELIKEGKVALEEILKKLETLALGIRSYIIFKDPKWAEASGRISHLVANWIRKMEKIGVRPLLGLKNGKVVPLGIVTGAKDIPTALFKEFKAKTQKIREQGRKIRAAITHGDNLEGVKKIKELIENNLKGVEIVFVNLVDDIIGILAGPDTLILVWVPLED